MAGENQANDPQTTPLTPEEFIRELRALRARLPMPEAAVTPAALRRRLTHVDARFVEASVNALGTSDSVQTALGRSDEDVRKEIDVIMRWSAGIDEMRELTQHTQTANTIRRQRVGLTALQTYQICQQLARDDGHARLRPHIAEMKRLNKFGRSRRRSTPPDSTLPEPEVEEQSKSKPQ